MDDHLRRLLEDLIQYQEMHQEDLTPLLLCVMDVMDKPLWAREPEEGPHTQTHEIDETDVHDAPSTGRIVESTLASPFEVDTPTTPTTEESKHLCSESPS